MKILIITNNTKPDSGWGRYSLGVINALKKRPGCDVTVLDEDGSGRTTRLLPAISVGNVLRNIMMVRRIAREYEIVHCLDCWPYGVYGMFGTICSKRKLFINGVGTYSVIESIYSLKGLLMWLSYKAANGVFCISDYTKKRILAGVRIKNIQTVHMGLDLLPVLSAEESSVFMSKFDIDKMSPIVLTVGAIKARKGQLHTLKAIHALKSEYPKILYIMVGSTSEAGYIEAVKRYIEENDLDDNVMILSDIKTDKELSFFYNICDVFALNSNNDGVHFEGFGLAILEANQFGKLAVGSRECGIEDAIAEGVNGFLSDQNDVKDISEKIKLAIASVVDKRMIIDRCKSFDWEMTVSAYLSYYTAVDHG